MPTPTTTPTADDFAVRIQRLRADLVDQGRRVQAMVEGAFSALFDRNAAAAAAVSKQDDIIDSTDVEIEKACVQLLTDATKDHAALDPGALRQVLTIAKVNNELERISDVAVDLAELTLVASAQVAGVGTDSLPSFPQTFRIVANSVIGILRDTTTSMRKQDPALAKVVLQSQHTVTAFKTAIIKEAEKQIAANRMPLDFAFTLHEVANLSEILADHCTNIAEQVIYVTTGAIVRHTEASWVEVGKGGR